MSKARQKQNPDSMQQGAWAQQSAARHRHRQRHRQMAADARWCVCAAGSPGPLQEQAVHMSLINI